jgi:muconate cycloisomerase
MRVVAAEIIEASVPFRMTFAHAAAERDRSDTVILKLTLEDGTTGYGEALARRYVTGETADTVVSTLERVAIPFAFDLSFQGAGEFTAFLRCPSTRPVHDGAAACALELALIDAFGNAFDATVPSLFGRDAAEAVTYSGVVGKMNGFVRRQLLRRMREAGLTRVKVKVGFGRADLDALRDCRNEMGSDVALGVDANGAWTADEALAALDSFAPFRVEFVEQPTPRDDHDALEQVTRRSPIPVILDESACSVPQVEHAVRHGLGHGVSIRISKVGGIANALQIDDTLRRAGLRRHVGALVGETGILAAAGRHLAAMTQPDALEGSFGDLLLTHDLTTPSIRFGMGGRGVRLDAPGLGVTVDAARLDRYAHARKRLQAA